MDAQLGFPASRSQILRTSSTPTSLRYPADMVADLYGRHGSRLLEGNVRSYLSNRGKVNKGIRTTV